MAKAKQPKQQSVQNRPLYSRISYLYQAATYLGSTTDGRIKVAADLAAADHENGNTTVESSETAPERNVRQSMSRHLLTDMRATSLKTLIRLSPSMKRTICKYCDTLLIESQTCTSVVENKSKGGKKPWADLMVITCNTCGGAKRFPVHGSRQKGRPARFQVKQDIPFDTATTAQPGISSVDTTS